MMRREAFSGAVLALLIGAPLAWAAGNPISVPAKYDGRWTIEATTVKGACPGTLSLEMKVTQGEATVSSSILDVAFNTHPEVREHRLYVLDNIRTVELLDWTYNRDPEFDLERFAARSFGAFWDGQSYDVEWRFKPQAAEDARSFRFHPGQVVTNNPDGSVTVRFTASGLTEMAWHLFTWGDSVEIVRPAALRQRYEECWRAAKRAFEAEL